MIKQAGLGWTFWGETFQHAADLQYQTFSIVLAMETSIKELLKNTPDTLN